MAKCYRCGCSLPPGTAISTKVLKGFKGRRKNGYVLMCAPCSQATHEDNKSIAIWALVGMAILAAIFGLIQQSR
jgi:hypothetical protein